MLQQYLKYTAGSLRFSYNKSEPLNNNLSYDKKEDSHQPNLTRKLDSQPIKINIASGEDVNLTCW